MCSSPKSSSRVVRPVPKPGTLSITAEQMTAMAVQAELAELRRRQSTPPVRRPTEVAARAEARRTARRARIQRIRARLWRFIRWPFSLLRP